MNHLTKQQFESIMQGQLPPPLHLRECRACTDRLAEKQALARRLRSAFASVQAGGDLAQRVKRRTRVRVHAADTEKTVSRTAHPVHWRYWMAAAAAVAVIPLLTMLFTPSNAMAAQEELVRIHTLNLDPDHAFFSESDPVKLASYFKRNLGFNPLMPQTRQGLALRGCCVKHFRGRQTGSYVVDTPDGVMSIIVVPDTLEDLGMTDGFKKNGYPFGRSHFADNNMVSVRIGNYTYCAVGEVSHDYLARVLEQLLADVET